MEMMKVLKLLGKALPVIIANAPVIAEAVRQIREALKKPAAPQPLPDGALPVAAE
jgi:hypothetical protein